MGSEVPNRNACPLHSPDHIGSASATGERYARIRPAFINHLLIAPSTSPSVILSAATPRPYNGVWVGEVRPLRGKLANGDALRFRPVSTKTVRARSLALNQRRNTMLPVDRPEGLIDQGCIRKLSPASHDNSFFSHAPRLP